MSSTSVETPNPFLSGLQATLGPALVEKIQSSKLLLVGAGGIGCELLKNLALTGFTNVEIIDLDTIDVSNLNRQLLFRSRHVGMPKCTVGAQVAADLAPTPVQYTAHHGNVCDNSQFHVGYFEKFDLVLNALDNVVARRRVNRLCLAANVPLVEAGTTGYLGQVNVISKSSQTACYECQTQEQQKVYPICTIRSTPSMPVHTIVWAKELYKLLFGEKVEESMLYEDPAGEEPSTYMQAVLEFRELREQAKTSKGEKNINTEASTALAHTLLEKLYVTEIQKQLDMDRFKTARKTPVVLEASALQKGLSETQAPTRAADYTQTKVWNDQECVAEWAACLQDSLDDPAVVLPAFDKDDDLSMRFVTAASNLRSMVFGITPIQSFYAAKGIAGNIIPAIATTNAICAGLQILQAFTILQAQLENKPDDLKERCSYINCIRNKTRNGLFLTAAKLEDPNPQCYVCKSAIVPLALNTKNWTLQDFLDTIVKKDLGFEHPTLELEGDIIWEEGEGADSESFTPNLVKLLPALPCGGIAHGSLLTIEDFSQDLTVKLSVQHQEIWEKKDGEEGGDGDDEHKFVIGGQKPVAAVAPEGKAETNGDDVKKPAAGEADDDDDVVEIVSASEQPNGEDAKRPASDANGDDVPPAKKAKTNSGMEVIEID